MMAASSPKLSGVCLVLLPLLSTTEEFFSSGLEPQLVFVVPSCFPHAVRRQQASWKGRCATCVVLIRVGSKGASGKVLGLHGHTMSTMCVQCRHLLQETSQYYGHHNLRVLFSAHAQASLPAHTDSWTLSITRASYPASCR